MASTLAEPLDSSDSADSKRSVNDSIAPASKSVKTTAADREKDRELVKAVQGGDHQAFRELFEKYHRRAFAVAFGVVKNQQDASDIVQEGFIKVHKHIQGFQGSSSFYTWLYRIIMNLSIDHVRRNKKARELDYDDGVAREDQSARAMVPKMLDGNPRKTILRRELADAIQTAMAELPDYHREVVMLREVEGLSYEEMAKILKVPKGTIMSRLFHARKRLQTLLGDYLQGDLQVGE